MFIFHSYLPATYSPWVFMNPRPIPLAIPSTRDPFPLDALSKFDGNLGLEMTRDPIPLTSATYSP